MNPLQKLHDYGQSPWIDDLHRDFVADGSLKKLIDAGVRGLTSNPAIFETAIAHSDEYDDEIRELNRKGEDNQAIYQTLTVEDVQNAADVFRPLYDQSGRKDGFVSYEVSPELATDTEGTCAQARKLWSLIDRPNAMIKIPATQEGLPAIEQLTADGINLNVTLIFGLPRYEAVAKAYIAGLRRRHDQGKSVESIASVASFFLSRIDILFDPQLEEMEKNGEAKAGSLRGEVAVASAKMAYQRYKELFEAESFSDLKEVGAKPQRLLWASTGVKNPEYAADKYIEPLIGSDTVNTMPPETLETYLKEGKPTASLEQGVQHAEQVLRDLEALEISIDDATMQLETEGAKKFVKPYKSLLETLAKAQDDAV